MGNIEILKIKLKAKPTKNGGAIKSQVQRLMTTISKLQKKKQSFVISCFGLYYFYMYDNDTWNIAVYDRIILAG